jgi:uncharacterized protein with GYD domain
MSKYLFLSSYTAEGIRGLSKVGGTNRKEIIGKMIADQGGKMEAFYYRFGEYDTVVIAELPDPATVAAFSFAINSSEMVKLSTTVLLEPAEVDQATKKAVNYLAPGIESMVSSQ